MTHFLKDILRQPEELQRTIEHLAGSNGAGAPPQRRMTRGRAKARPYNTSYRIRQQ